MSTILLAIARAESLPVSPEDVEHPTLPSGTWDEVDAAPELVDDAPTPPPQLVVSTNGAVVKQLVLDRPRLLVGRSEHNDIAINSRFISRHHALLVRHGNSTFLMDLNSTNGTYVNGGQITNRVLRHEDVVTVGHHKIKFYDPFATGQNMSAGEDYDDTVIMKTLEDMRSLLASEDNELMPPVSEDLPTIQT